MNFLAQLNVTGKRKAVEMEDAPVAKTKLASGKAEPTASDDANADSKQCFIGQLSWNVDNDWLASEFAECGEVVSARVQMDRNTGRSRGFGFVEFTTVEAANACVALNGKEIDGRPVKIDKSTPPTPNPEKRAKVFGDVPSEPSSVLFVGNVSWNTSEDSLWNIFAEYGEVKSVRLPTDRDTQKPKGFAYVEFVDIETAKAAYEGAAGSEIDGRAIRLDFSQPREGGGGGGGGGGFNKRGRGGADRGWGGRGGGSFGSDRGGRVRVFGTVLNCVFTHRTIHREDAAAVSETVVGEADVEAAVVAVVLRVAVVEPERAAPLSSEAKR